MENKDNSNLEAFVQDFKKIMGKLEMESGELIYLTDDNSFPNFLIDFCHNIGADVETAIKEEEQKPKERGYIENCFDRYIYSAINSLSVKAISDRLQLVLLDVNILLSNWLRMVEESNLYSVFCINEKAVKTTINTITDSNDILKGVLNLEKLVWMTGNLITKAKEVLSATPPSFNISEQYARAVSKALKKED